MEIERKFLADAAKIPAALNTLQKIQMGQSYVSVNPTIRIRKENENYILAVKSKGGMTREEFEMPIDKEQYAHLLKKTETPLLEKCRYLYPLADGLTAEIDVYEGDLAGLVTIEVEFKTEDAANAFTPPGWFGEEVTWQQGYKNSSLALYGIPKKI